jgi:hypothetical protein
MDLFDSILSRVSIFFWARSESDQHRLSCWTNNAGLYCLRLSHWDYSYHGDYCANYCTGSFHGRQHYCNSSLLLPSNLWRWHFLKWWLASILRDWWHLFLCGRPIPSPTERLARLLQRGLFSLQGLFKNYIHSSSEAEVQSNYGILQQKLGHQTDWVQYLDNEVHAHRKSLVAYYIDIIPGRLNILGSSPQLSPITPLTVYELAQNAQKSQLWQSRKW